MLAYYNDNNITSDIYVMLSATNIPSSIPKNQDEPSTSKISNYSSLLDAVHNYKGKVATFVPVAFADLRNTVAGEI